MFQEMLIYSSGFYEVSATLFRNTMNEQSSLLSSQEAQAQTQTLQDRICSPPRCTREVMAQEGQRTSTSQLPSCLLTSSENVPEHAGLVLRE